MPTQSESTIKGDIVGGLTAAATFARRGVEVVLIERRPTFDIPGVGLGQPANALRVYDALGVLDARDGRLFPLPELPHPLYVT